MKLIEAIKERGSPFIIPDCSREGLPEFLKEMGYKTGAEIGVLEGVFSEQLCKAGLKMYCIDPWIGFYGQGRKQGVQEIQDSYYQTTVNRLKPYPDCTIIRKTSMEALADIPDGSLDFVYIDGNHLFKYIAEDLFEWSKKVRHGGIISGHDYVNSYYLAKNIVCHVGNVVDAFVKTFHIENWYVFKKANTTDKDLNSLSYLWINP